MPLVDVVSCESRYNRRDKFANTSCQPSNTDIWRGLLRIYALLLSNRGQLGWKTKLESGIFSPQPNKRSTSQKTNKPIFITDTVRDVQIRKFLHNFDGSGIHKVQSATIIRLLETVLFTESWRNNQLFCMSVVAMDHNESKTS